MKRAILIFITCLFFSVTAFADVKIKIRQTMSGESYENTTYIKGKRERTEQNFGGMQTVNITQCDLRRDLQIMPASQAYIVNVWQNAPSEKPTTATEVAQTKTEKGGIVTMTTTVKDTGERKQMFGYTARHLIITMETDSSPDACQRTKSKMQMDGWYIDATFAFDCLNDRYAGYVPKVKTGGCQDRFQTKQIGTGKRGYPLYEKMTMFDETGKETYSTVNEVLEISKATLEDALFDIPAGYREVKDASQLYQTAASGSSSASGAGGSMSSANYSNGNSANSGFSQNVQNLSQSNENGASAIGAKREGTIRIGLAAVKTGAVGEGLNAQELAAAVQNTFGEFFKGTNIEVVPLEARLAAVAAEEAKQKECDYVLAVTVSHKKGGGGGFGMMLGKMSEVVSRQAIGSSDIGGQIARTTIVSAAAVSGNVKAKDEITLDVNLQKTADNASALTRQFKVKAKSNGDDIISQAIEQAATAIVGIAK